ncbi:hypothetical protein L083_2508 [Actinoplanes sp. N902-109]|nr:hypothetical protein L083_2508 [Actinoplanes sp. N902-109]
MVRQQGGLDHGIDGLLSSGRNHLRSVAFLIPQISIAEKRM